MSALIERILRAYVTLRDYQDDAVSHLLWESNRKWRGLVLPTASGKTLAVQVAAYLAVTEQKYKGVIIATPFENIEGPFSLRDLFVQGIEELVVTYTPPDEPPRDVVIPVGAIKQLRDTVDTPRKEAERTFASGGIVVTTHAQLVRLHQNGVFPESLEGWILAPDEWHHIAERAVNTPKGHAGGTEMFRVTETWSARGGVVWPVTATPFRADGLKIAPNDIDILAFAYSEIAERGGLPTSLRFNVVGLPAGDEDRAKGLLLDKDYTRVAKYIRKVGRITLLRIGQGNPDLATREVAERFKRALVAQGYAEDEILITVGDDVGDETNDAILQERITAKAQGYNALKIKVVISCRRVGEGTDWPPCNHVVSIGLSESLVAVIQLLGRGARPKRMIPGYPADQIDDVLFTAFVPEVAQGSAEERKQVRRILQIACGLECDDSIRDYQRLWRDAVDNFRLPSGLRKKKPALRRFAGFSMHDRAEAGILGEEAIALARSAFQRDDVTFGDVEKIVRRWSGADRARVMEVLVLRAAKESPELRAAHQSSISDILQETVRALADSTEEADAQVIYLDVLAQRLETLVDRFKDVLVKSVVDSEGSYLTSHLTPDRMREVAAAMAEERDAAFRLSDIDIVQKVILPYKARYRTPPSTMQGVQNVSDMIGALRTLTDIDQALRRTDFSLNRLNIVAKYVAGPPIDVEELRAKLGDPRMLPTLVPQLWASVAALGEHMRIHSRYDLTHVFGRQENYVLLELACRRGWRGLPGGQTLYGVLTSFPR